MADANDPCSSECIKPNTTDSFQARSYQVELFEKAVEENTIVCLKTGAGKTFIAVMLIKEYQHEVLKNYNEGKRTFFLVPKVALVFQQAKVIEDHTVLKVGRYCGAGGVDLWNTSRWRSELEEHHVLVMTAQILLNMLTCGHMPLDKINLIVFDECHVATGKNPYCGIVSRFKDFEDKPRVLGLTASILNGKCKKNNIVNLMTKLEVTLSCRIETSSDMVSVNTYSTKPKEVFIVFADGQSRSSLEKNILTLLDTSRMFMMPILELEKKRKQNNYSSRSGNDFAYLSEIFDDISQDIDDDSSNEFIKSDDIDLASSPYSMLKNVQTVMSQLGVYCAHIIVEKYLTDLPNFRQTAEGQLDRDKVTMYDIVENGLLEMKRLMLAHSLSIDMITPKLRRLLEFLATVNPTSKVGADCDNVFNWFRGIVFVQLRVIAWILKEYIIKVSLDRPSLYGFVKPCYVVGHGCNLIFQKRACMNVDTQKKIVDEFRDGNTNLMIATVVVEEGLDIPKCNVVVRFDPPNTFCSYIQSMGRARAKKALYVFLVSAADFDGLQNDIFRFKVVEDFLNSRCKDRDVPSEARTIEFYASQHKILPFYPAGQEGACLTMTSALSILNMYVSRIPHDRYTVLKPHIRYVRTDENMFCCIITMPVGCPLKLSIKGQPMPDKDDARRVAGFLVCKLLHEIGELNDNLLPCVGNCLKKYISQLGIAPEETTILRSAIAGTKRRKLIYKKQIAADLRNVYPKPGRPVFLYVIQVQNADFVEYGYDQGSTTKRSRFGILSLSPIANVCPFFLYSKRKYIVSFSGENEFANGNNLTEYQLECLGSFHRTVFDVVLRLVGKGMIYQPDEAALSFLVVPIKKSIGNPNFEIDWDTVSSAKIQERRRLGIEDIEIPEIGSVVEPIYGDEAIRNKRFVVLDVLKEQNPQSPFPTDGNARSEITYESYFLSKYGISLRNEQPLLRLTYAPNAMNLLIPKTVESASREVMLFPGIVQLLPLSIEMFEIAFFLPCIVDRLNGLLVAKQLADEIVREAHIVQSLVPSREDGNSLEEICKKMIIDDTVMFCSSGRVPQTLDSNKLYALIFQSLTATVTGNWDDLERLELIGDSFLKFVVSVFLYCKFSHAKEGSLSILRAGLVKNYNLCTHAKIKNLPEKLNASLFQPKINFVPPGYVFPQHLVRQLIAAKIPSHLWQFAEESPSSMSVSEWREMFYTRSYIADSSKNCLVDSDEEIPYNHYREQCINDKTVADSVEALIGAVLASCGQMAALRLINWFGLRLNDTNDEDCEKDDDIDRNDPVDCYLTLFNWKISKRSALLRVIPDGTATQIYSGLHILENKLGYKFNDISFLRQAVVHPSFSEQPFTDTYEKLEFLGDAILDYLITMHLFKTNPQLSQGNMTDLRSSLVDNTTFAFLAVKNGIYQHMRYKSPSLYQAIEKYLAYHARLKDPKEAIYMFGENEVLEMSDVEVPKALGDIFESVAGAVYVDSGFSLKIVWDVFFPIMKDLIGMYSVCLPINPVRKLFEYNSQVKFSKPLKLDTSSLYVVHVSCDNKTYVGRGPTKVVAKQAAAKCALRDLNLPSDRKLNTSV